MRVDGPFWVYIPFLIKGTRKIHSFQIGWSPVNSVPAYEDALGLKGGGDQHLLETVNSMQCVQVEEWYAYWEQLCIDPHPLCYSQAEKRFRRENEAIAWIIANPGKRYIIGNEPDGGYAGGGNAMTEEEFADFLFASVTLIRNADPNAYLIMGGWAGGIAMESSFAHNEDHCLEIYNQKYGTLDVDALSWHSYQYGSFDNPYPVSKMNKFASYAKIWANRGWTRTTDICLTEFGWYGLDTKNNTPENCIKFMDWFVPQLKAHPQVTAYYWWWWGEGARLVKDGEPTEVGLHYSELSRG